MVVTCPLGMRIPVGPTPEQNPVLCVKEAGMRVGARKFWRRICTDDTDKTSYFLWVLIRVNRC